MKTYLSNKVADYPQILTINPTTVMPVTGDKNQVVLEYDDVNIDVISVCDQSVFTLQLQWEYRNDTDRDIIFNWWHDPLKANGRARTFYWQHPVLTTEYYTVRFLTPLQVKFFPHLIQSIDVVTIRVEGNKPA
jgi:hypothetical protein